MYFIVRTKSAINSVIKFWIHLFGSIFIRPFIGKPDFQKLDPQKPYKILYVCLAFRGDLVVNFPAINAIKSHFPNSKITCWLHDYNEPLARLIPAVDNVISYGDSGRSAISLFLEFLRGTKHSPFLQKLKEFDLYIDDSGYSYTALAGFRSKIPYRIGRNFQGFGFLNHREFPLDFNVQLIERRLKLLQPFGLKLSLKDIPKPYMKISPEIITAARTKFGISSSDYFAVQPFAGWEAKNWGLDKYCQVTREFSIFSGLLPVFIGSPAEQPLIKESLSRLELNAVNIAGLASLDESTAIIAGSRFYFGPDSIGNHLAIALGIKSLTMFGPTHPTLSSYLGGVNIGIRKITRCTPGPGQAYCCIDGGRSCRHNVCMIELRQEDVLETLRQHWSGEKLPIVVEF